MWAREGEILVHVGGESESKGQLSDELVARTTKVEGWVFWE